MSFDATGMYRHRNVNTPVYVGTSARPSRRFRAHLNDAIVKDYPDRRHWSWVHCVWSAKAEWITDVALSGHLPEVVIIYRGGGLHLEAATIRAFRDFGFPLTNGLRASAPQDEERRMRCEAWVKQLLSVERSIGPPSA